APSIHIWDPAAFQERHILKEHDDEIRCLAFSPDGRQLASGGADRVIHLWDPHQGRLLSARNHPTQHRTHLVVDPNSNRLTSTCAGLQLRVGDIATGQPSFSPTEPPPPESLAASTDGHWLATGTDTHILLWDTRTGQLQATLEGPPGKVAALAFA